MYSSMSKIQKTKALFIMIFVAWVTAFDEAKDDKTLTLKLGFDLTREKNRAPSLRIRNFEVPEFSRQKFKEEKRKRAESSSESDEPADNDKVASEVKEPKDSDGSEDDDTSGSNDDRRLSTKGISPDEFEPERNPSVHERIISKTSDSE